MTLRVENPAQHLGDALSDPEASDPTAGRNEGMPASPNTARVAALSAGERAPQTLCPCKCGGLVLRGQKYADVERCRKRIYRAKVKTEMEAAGLPALPSLRAADRTRGTGACTGDAQNGQNAPQTTEGDSELCTPTTSGTTYLHLAVSGPPSPAKRSPSSISISPPPAPAPRKPSCVSSVPPISELTIARLRQEIPSPADVQAELEDEWREIDGRRLARGRLGGGHVTARCPGCKAFVRNPSVRHDCGYTPGLGWAA